MKIYIKAVLITLVFFILQMTLFSSKPIAFLDIPILYFLIVIVVKMERE